MHEREFHPVDCGCMWHVGCRNPCARPPSSLKRDNSSKSIQTKYAIGKPKSLANMLLLEIAESFTRSEVTELKRSFMKRHQTAGSYNAASIKVRFPHVRQSPPYCFVSSHIVQFSNLNSSHVTVDPTLSHLHASSLIPTLKLNRRFKHTYGDGSTSEHNTVAFDIRPNEQLSARRCLVRQHLFFYLSSCCGKFQP